MQQILVDTNVLLSFLTDRSPAQQAHAAELFHEVAAGRCRAILHQNVLVELVFVLGNLYRVPSQEISAIVQDALGLPGIETRDRLFWPLVLELWPKVLPDFGDALLASVCRQSGADAIATFDRRFARRLGRLGLATLWN
jgi:predicted nucleic-acid-binding protein